MKKQKKNKKTIILIVITLAIFIVSLKVYDSLKDVDFSKYSSLLNINGKGSLIDDYSNLKDSGITGEDYQVDINYYPYYAALNTNEKDLYKQIYANVTQLKRTFVPVTEINKDDISEIIESVTNDHPELFWLDLEYTYRYTKDGICRQITLKFNKLYDNYEENRNKVESEVNYIVSKANRLSNNYEKEKYVHNYLINKIDYNLNASYNQTIYSALINNSTVCAGYAKAFQYIMMRMNIPTYYVTGRSSGERHAWNITYIYDGFYNIDLTWDDAANNHYMFFNLTDSAFSSSHKRSDISLNLPTCTSTRYSYRNTTSTQSTPKPSNSPTPSPKEEITNKTPNEQNTTSESTNESDNEKQNVKTEEETDENEIKTSDKTNDVSNTKEITN